MPKYIDAEYFAERLKVSPAFPNYHNGLFMRDIALGILENMPAADVVEVVRCKDCKHCGSRPSSIYPYCTFFKGFTSDNFFCGNGKRKEQT